MAQESGCISSANDGISVGLMAITPRSWTPTWAELLDPNLNIEWGMWFLYSAINNELYNPNHSLRLALAAYNCGWTGVETDNCGSTGGYIYADRILNFWLPMVRDRLCSASIYNTGHQEWLILNGYCSRYDF